MNPSALITAACEAFKHAHAPYSRYRVGAALLCADGSVVKGCNVENASYGLTNCAERTALFAAIANGTTDFMAIAIAASDSPAPFPCGACLQVLSEFCGPDFPIHVASSTEREGYVSTTLGALLPLAFDLKMEPPRI
jgi:cytidine deaminase